MHEDALLGMLEGTDKPLSITEIRDMLSKKLRRSVPYETAKKDLLTLAAKGLVNCKSIGKGKRVTWIFWSRAEPQSQGEALTKADDPFAVSPADRDRMNSQELASMYDSVASRCQDIARAEFRSGSRYLILSDGRIVKTSDREPSDEEVRSLERRLGKVCYVLTQDRIEESRWSSLGGGDHYPTIEVFLADRGSRDDEVFDRGIHLVSDFDTGNPDVAAFDKNQVDLVQVGQAPLMRRAFHLGSYYNYCTASLKIGIRDSKDDMRCIQKTCRTVFSWTDPSRNPFLLANPKRRAFLGRDLMMSFPFSICLSGRNRRSTVTLE